MQVSAKLTETRPLPEQFGGTHHQIVAAATESRLITAQLNQAISAVGTVQLISEVDALHHHRQFMKPIRALTEHLKVEIDFGGSGDANGGGHPIKQQSPTDSNLSLKQPRHLVPRPGVVAEG